MADATIKKHLVYAHYLDGTLIYIGCGSRARTITKTNRNYLWMHKVGSNKFDVKILGEFKSKSEALEEELRLIEELMPECNILGRPKKLTEEEKSVIKMLKAKSEYDRIAVDITEEKKRKLIKHTKETGQGVSFVVRKLLDLFLAGKVSID